MTKSVRAWCLFTVVCLGQAAMASASVSPSYDDQTATASNKKQADNPKKPTQSKNPKATEKVKTDDRMSTRGLKPPPKDESKDKPAKTPEQPKQ